jgi:hypothetical protein
MGTPVDQLPIELDQGALQTRYVEEGEMAIRHVRVPAGTDMSPVLHGLPGDRCPQTTLGIVLEGTIRVTRADGSTEVARAGEVYHWPAGHTASVEEDVVFIEVGPVGQMRQFGDHGRLSSARPDRARSHGGPVRSVVAGLRVGRTGNGALVDRGRGSAPLASGV